MHLKIHLAANTSGYKQTCSKVQKIQVKVQVKSNK
jgi:hypothetical protein